MRTPFVVVVALAALAARADAAPVDRVETPSTVPALSTSIVVAPFFDEIVGRLLSFSPTLRDQYQRIAAVPRVRVWVQSVFGQPGTGRARSTISRSASGVLFATIELATPMRDVEYAEMLAHEFEHVLEQVEGLDLGELADRRDGGVARLRNGSYETERARRAGRAAAMEIENLHGP